MYVYDIVDNETTCPGETNKRQSHVRSDNEPEPGPSKRQEPDTYIHIFRNETFDSGLSINHCIELNVLLLQAAD